MLRGQVMKFITIIALAIMGLMSGAWLYIEHPQGALAALALPQTATTTSYATPEESDPYVRFDMEVFDIISANYWQPATEADVANLFREALARVSADPAVSLPSPNRAGLAQMLAEQAQKTPEAGRKDLAVNTAIVALQNLYPAGRSGLLTNKQEQQFRDTVANVDNSRNLYDTLGVPQGSAPSEVQAAFEAKKQELAASSSPAAAEALKQAEYAKDVLTGTTTKALYDQAKIEPSLSSDMLDAHTLYLDLRQITPGSFAEFEQRMRDLGGDSAVTNLIIDLRGNIGGTLDFARYLFGMFVGPNQFAFDLFHKGEFEAQRTPAEVAAYPALAHLDHVALLVNGMTQSTAELISSVFQRVRLGVVVGEPTRGWGTVENTFPIKTEFGDGVSYAVLLVHSLTVRPDGQPIDSLGITPDVDTRSKDWRSVLSSKVHSSAFTTAIERALSR